jgi:uncharacterized damage-inducible protein DinB
MRPTPAKKTKRATPTPATPTTPSSPVSDVVVSQVLEAWRTNNRINLFLLDRISEEGLRCSLSTRGGRDVARQFAHMHDVRVWHVEARAKALSKGLRKFASKESPPRDVVKEALVESCEVVAVFLESLLHGTARGYKKGPIQHLAYLIAHESHHRGSVLLTLKQSGHKMDQADSYAIWDWDRV